MVFIYITEAHASDEWNIGSQVQYKKPKFLQDRIQIAQDMLDSTNLSLPMFIDVLPVDDKRNDVQSNEEFKTDAVDNFNDPIGYNLFNHYYSAWPLRFYIIQEQRVKYISSPGNNGEIIPGQIIDALHQILNVNV